MQLWRVWLLTPEITLVALSVLLGKKLGGTRGIVASLAGLLVPSAAITCLVAALFKQLEQVVLDILKGAHPHI